jgi:hypothetical protein
MSTKTSNDYIAELRPIFIAALIFAATYFGYLKFQISSDYETLELTINLDKQKIVSDFKQHIGVEDD